MPRPHEIYEEDVKRPLGKRLQKQVRLWKAKNKDVQAHQDMIWRLWVSGFFDHGYGREHLINLIDRGVGTIVPYLVEGDPKVLVSTLIGNYKPWAYTTQLALNFFLQQMEFADTVLIPAARNSMFGAGITRTFTEYDRRISLDNEEIKAGRPVVKVIHDTDYIGDPCARCREDFAFEGDMYRLPTSYAKDLFAGKDSSGKQIADYIKADCQLTNDFSPEHISDPNFNKNRFALRDYTTFVDIYLFDENVTVTIMPEGQLGKILRRVEEDGPNESPYDYLGYAYFPGHPTPIPPTWRMYDMDVSINLVAKTAREQAEAQKDLLLAEAPNKELAKQILNAKNMDVLNVKDAKGVLPVSFGGMNTQSIPYMELVEIAFNKAGGTSEIMGGRGAEAPTLGQEQMIFQNASRIVNNMYSRFHRFMTSIVRKLAWRIWTDPTVYIPLIHEVPGVGTLPKIFSQADKVGEFYDFVFSIDPYSTQRMSPEMKYQRFMQFATQWLLPTAQIGAQQGAELDVPETTNRLANYLGFEDFSQLYRTVTGSPMDQVPYTMQPNANKGKSTGQMNDAFGAMLGSREANSQQKQGRDMMSPMGVDKVGA